MRIEIEARQAKLAKLRGGSRPRALELCSGCGGLSLGMASAGFELVAHVEADPTAAESYALNFAPKSEDIRQLWSQPRDMTKTDPATLAKEIGLEGSLADHFDVLAAGLPCQAFARIGRPKLRAVTGDMDAFKNDSRAKLYQRFLQFVEATQPVAILIENVPDILNFGGHNVPEEICATLEELGYVARYTLLNSVHYGVPQLRERLFLVAIDASLGFAPEFPEPTHQARLPSGYQAVRSVALKHVPKRGSHFSPAPKPARGLPPSVSVRTALSDLPKITEHFADPPTMRRRKVADLLPYRTFSGLSPYAKLMRAWPGLAISHAGTNGHLVRITPRDFPIFKRMKQGGDYPHACEVAEALFQEHLKKDGRALVAGSADYEKLRKKFVPPYDPGKFPNKWWKLDPTRPSRTLTAHLGKDTYSHLHWDGGQQRTISVREAARLQSFPDSFQFAGAMNAAFRQIGNAVPPLLAKAVARMLKQNLLQTPIKSTSVVENSEAA